MSDIIAAITVLALVMSSAIARRPDADRSGSSQSGQAQLRVIRPTMVDEETYSLTPENRRREEDVIEEGVLVRLYVIDHE